MHYLIKQNRVTFIIRFHYSYNNIEEEFNDMKIPQCKFTFNICSFYFGVNYELEMLRFTYPSLMQELKAAF